MEQISHRYEVVKVNPAMWVKRNTVARGLIHLAATTYSPSNIFSKFSMISSRLISEGATANAKLRY